MRREVEARLYPPPDWTQGTLIQSGEFAGCYILPEPAPDGAYLVGCDPAIPEDGSPFRLVVMPWPAPPPHGLRLPHLLAATLRAFNSTTRGKRIRPNER